MTTAVAVTKDELDETNGKVAELAKHLLTVSKRVYDEATTAKDHDEDEEHPMPVPPKKDEGVVMSRKALKAAYTALMAQMPMDDDEEEEEGKPPMFGKRGKKTAKGFADSAKDAKNEEDTPFDQKADSDVDGNETVDPGKATTQSSGSAPGAGAGVATLPGMDRGDETFNVSAAMAQVQKTMGQIEVALAGEGTQLAKAVVPGVVRSGDRNQAGEGLTREMEIEVKGRTYKEINALRQELGDLPRFGFMGR